MEPRHHNIDVQDAVNVEWPATCSKKAYTRPTPYKSLAIYKRFGYFKIGPEIDTLDLKPTYTYGAMTASIFI